jgi:hypothetical protein
MKELIFKYHHYISESKEGVANMRTFIYYISTIFKLYEDNTTSLYYQIK